MVVDAGLSMKYSAFAVSAVVYLKNHTPTHAVVGKTPYEAWHGTERCDL
jgi:hypothetical protein